MAWGAFNACGTGGNVAASASEVHTIATNALAVGDVGIIYCCMDNLGTVDGWSNQLLTVVDSQGNQWWKLGEWLNTVGGVAGDGVASAIWASHITKALAITTDTVTLTFSGSITAKAWAMQKSSVAAGNTFKRIAYSGLTIDASLTGPAHSISGLANVAHAALCLDGLEGPGSDTYTQDAAFTSTLLRGTANATATNNVCVNAGIRSFTATSVTHTGSNNIARDWASLLVVLDEVPDTYVPQPRRRMREAVGRAANY